jgi:voltage-gated potassium channel
MTDNDTTSTRSRQASLVERRARRIANARSVVFGLAGTFVGLALAGAALMRLADPTNFPSFGLAVWWALQTVTTVGYGDVVPTTTTGRLLGGVEMVLGVSFIAFLTAAVTSAVIQRGDAQRQAADERATAHNTQAIIDAVADATRAITDLDKRLDRIEAGLKG